MMRCYFHILLQTWLYMALRKFQVILEGFWMFLKPLFVELKAMFDEVLEYSRML